MFQWLSLTVCIDRLGNKTNRKGNIKMVMSQIPKSINYMVVQSSIYFVCGTDSSKFESKLKGR